MNLNIDIATMIFAVTLGHVFSAVLGFAYMVQHKKDIAFYAFLLARLFSVLGWGILALLNENNQMVFTVIGNTGLMISECLQMLAFLGIKNHNPQVLRLGAFISSLCVVIVFSLLIIDLHTDGGMRISVMSILIMFLWIYPLSVLMSGKNSTVLQKVVALIYGAGFFVLALQAYVNVRPDGAVSAMQSHFSNVIFVVTLFPIMLAGNMGFILMAKEKADFELKRAATYDGLTDIYNRSTFLMYAQKYITLCARRREPLSFFMMDLDHFKGVNDFYGHKAGDMVLSHFAALCKTQLRGRDLIGRLGGEEFAAVLLGLDEGQAHSAAERLRKAVEESSVVIGQSMAVRYTASIGVSTVIPNEGTTLDMLYKWSDDALYQAKKSGRNRVVLSSEGSAYSTK